MAVCRSNLRAFHNIATLSDCSFYAEYAETSLPPVAVNAIIAAIVGFNFLTALSPLSSTFSESNQADVKKRPQGAVQNPKINPVQNPQEFLGIDKVSLQTVQEFCFVGHIDQT